MSKVNSELIQYRVDSKVINLFLVLGVVGLVMLGYLFYSYTPEPEVNFALLGKDHKIKEIIKFENKTYGKHEFLWDFGDSSKVSLLRNPVHMYDAPGEYEITLLVDNQYKKKLKVVINQEYQSAPSIVMPKIVGPSTVYAGKEFTFKCPTENVKYYAWYVEGKGKPAGYKSEFTYKFDKPGYKEVMLIVNGEKRYSVKQTVYVKDKKNKDAADVVENGGGSSLADAYIPDKPDVYVKIDELNKKDEKVFAIPPDPQLQVELVNVMTKEGKVADFVRYLNGGADYKLIFANQEYISFNEMAKELKGNEFVIKEFSTLRNDNRIAKLTIRYRIKKKLL